MMTSVVLSIAFYQPRTRAASANVDQNYYFRCLLAFLHEKQRWFRRHYPAAKVRVALYTDAHTLDNTGFGALLLQHAPPGLEVRVMAPSAGSSLGHLTPAFRFSAIWEYPESTVILLDIHDDPRSQDKHLQNCLALLDNSGKDALFTYWVACDSAEDCLVESPLPLPRKPRGCWHAHTDAGLVIWKGVRPGAGPHLFLDYLCKTVPLITNPAPSGDEMLFEVFRCTNLSDQWLRDHVVFAKHRCQRRTSTPALPKSLGSGSGTITITRFPLTPSRRCSGGLLLGRCTERR